jgi:hypothetical protein
MGCLFFKCIEVEKKLERFWRKKGKKGKKAFCCHFFIKAALPFQESAYADSTTQSRSKSFGSAALGSGRARLSR